jgi:hypothetical protein
MPFGHGTPCKKHAEEQQIFFVALRTVELFLGCLPAANQPLLNISKGFVQLIALLCCINKLLCGYAC